MKRRAPILPALLAVIALASAGCGGFEAFGVPSTPPTEPARIDQPGRTTFGAFLGDELVAKAIDRAYDSYFGGAAVPTSGIAGRLSTTRWHEPRVTTRQIPLFPGKRTPNGADSSSRP